MPEHLNTLFVGLSGRTGWVHYMDLNKVSKRAHEHNHQCSYCSKLNLIDEMIKETKNLDKIRKG